MRRPLYRGEIVHNKTRQRDTWGQKCKQERDESEWITVEAPELRIVPSELAKTVDARMDAMRSRALRTSDGRLLGRLPARGRSTS